jgi:asparagine synthase (glutamine-hydrolysing)
MCGIVGGIGDRASEIIRKNMPLLSHRGPDHQAFLTLDSGLTLGATRLSITDPLPRSNQPMIDQVNGNVLIFNGEIYNYKELKKSLLSLGLKFSTESDTEVLLKLLGYFGLSGVSKLEGMYAFAFFDYKKNSLVLSRDFLGKKPLYYYCYNQNLFFSSSFNFVSKSLVNLTLDPSSIATYLRLGYNFDPNTLIKEIKSLQPGVSLEINLLNLRVNQHFFPPAKFLIDGPTKVEEALDISINERVSGHEKFAISMSGGVDSSLIAMRCKEMGLTPELYSLSFSNSDKSRYSDDAKAAEQIAKCLKLKFNLVEMSSPNEIPTILEAFIDAMEEPNANPTGLSMMTLWSSIAKDGHRVVLTGDGSDEIFGGYPRYIKAMQVERLPKINLAKFRNFLENKSIQSDYLDKFLWSVSRYDSLDRWLYLHQIIDGTKVKRIYNVEDNINYDLSLIKVLESKYGSNKNVSDLMIKDLAIWLSMESNKRLDRISMWNSVEARSPFQSENLIASGLQVMRSNNFRILDKKVIFEIFPKLSSLPLLTRKAGFTSPIGHWLRSNQDLVNQNIGELIKSSLFVREELLNLVSSPMMGEYKKVKILWSLIVFSTWMRKYNL